MANANYTNSTKEELQDILQSAEDANVFIQKNYKLKNIFNWKDVPGWINDAAWIYKDMVVEAEEGDHFIEVGTYFGQSACRMGELIKQSGKNIKFDSIDSYYMIDPSMRAGFHPQQFIDYRMGPELSTKPMKDVVKIHLYKCDVYNYVNLLCIESEISHKLYNDFQLKFVYIDGSHFFEDVYRDLKNLWPKIKSGGVMAGDDIMYEDVKKAFDLFVVEENELIEYTKINEFSFIIRKK